MAKAIPIPVVQVGFEQSIEAGKRAAGTINLPVNIDPSAFKNLNQPLGRITGLATEFEKSIAASNARVLAFGASVGILNGVASAFKSILDNGIAVEKALADIGSVSGQSAAQLDQLGDSLFNVAKNTSQSFGTAAKAALEFSRQGLSVEETVKRTNDALTLTRFTSLSAADAVDTLTAAVNSFSGAGITTTEILNKLIAVDSAFAVSAEDLANGLARAGSIAQEVGVTFDELNGLITVAQEKTARGGSVIGNALKTIFTRIRSDETINALRAVGVESLDTAGNLRDVVPILTDLSVKLKDLSGGERIQILEAVASKYNINILSALLGDIGNAQGQFSKALEVSLGSSNEAFARQVELNKTLDAVLNQSAVSAGELANNLAKIGLNDNLKSLVGYVNSFLDSINKLLSSTDTGGDIARGIIKGFSDVLFKVGLPIIAAIFVKLTRDIAVFGVESLQTILGINQKVKERQALEQAVTNTLISNKSIMDQILASSGNRVKQEQILLKAYNEQIQALSVIQSISASVAPALQGAGLVATSGGVAKKKAAGGYLPSQEAADVRRGVGGASSSSKVVSIPNFAFGGGKKGTMIANTSEYVVPNFANGGSAIFNQDMVKAYGLPAGAKKIGAAGGYVPNFAKYVYDSDRIPADKNATLKAILASSAKKNLLIAPAGAGKSTLAAGMGKFLTGAGDVANATEIDILSGAGRTKDGGLSKNLESIMAAVNASGGKVSYLYTKNFDILSRRAGRTDPSEGDLRSKKQLAGTAYAPLNQFDFMGMVKSKANSFGMVRGAGGYIPNFADVNEPERFAALIGKKTGRDDGLLNRYSRWVYKDPQGKVEVDNAAKLSSLDQQDEKLIQFNTYGIPSKSDSQLTDVKEQLSEYGKNSAVQLAKNMTSQKLPSDLIQGKLAATFNPGSLASFAGTIFEASVGALLGDKSFQDYSEQAVTSAFDLDIRGNDAIKKDFKIPKNIEYLEVKGSDSPPLIKSIAKKIYQVTELNRAATSKTKIGAGKGVPQPIYDLNNLTVVEGVDRKTRTFKTQKDLENYLVSNYTKTYHVPALNSPSIDKGLWPTLGPRTKRGAAGYIPNFAQGGPLEDAIQREMAAGLDPSQIRVTKDGRLKNSRNPDGFAVINTRDEPDGKIPNFSKNEAKIRKQILGKGTAEGPLLPKGYQIPQNSGGYVFDYGVGSAQANPNASPEATAKTEADKKAALSTGKLTAAFSALTVASFTLQSTLKDSDSSLGKFLTGLSQVGSSAAGYGSLGSLAGSALESNKGFLGKAAGYMGPAGIALGAGIGIYQAMQQPRQEELSAARGAGSKQAEEDYKNIVESIDEATAQQDALNKKVEEYREQLASANVELENAKKGPSFFSAVMSSSVNGEYATVDERMRTADSLIEGPKNDKRKREAEIALETQQQRLRDQQARVDALKNSADNARKRDQAARKKAGLLDESGKPIVSRVALQAESANTTVAFAEAQLKVEEKLFKIQEDSLKIANSLNDSQARQLGYTNAITLKEQEVQDTRRKNLENFLKELEGSSAIANVKKDELKSLQERLQKGETLLSVTEEINRLGVQDSAGLGEKVTKAGDLARIEDTRGNAAVSRLKTTQGLIEANYNELNLSERVLKYSQQQESSQFRINEYIKERIKLIENIKGSSIESESNPQSQLNTLNAKIAGQLRPTQSQTVERTRLTDQLNAFKQRNDLAAEEENLKTQRDRQLKEGYSSAVSGLNINPVNKNNVLRQITNATTQEEYQDLFNEAVKLADQQMKASGSTADAGAIIIAARSVENIVKKNTETAKIDAEVIAVKKKDLEEQLDIESKILEKRLQILRAEGKGGLVGRVRAIDEISAQAESFSENFSYNTTLGFRDGLRDALDAAISGTDDLKGALQGVAQGFLRTMQQAFLKQASDNAMIGLSKALPSFFQMPVTKSQGGYIQKFASGGFVTGGSGIRDDVPAMLSSGEYVMRKSAVQKYGAENMAKMNNGGIFLPGVRGGSEISGYDQLSKFANQTTTSGATDVLRGSKSTAFANLEDQSARLSRFGLMNEDTIKGEITSAQQQGLDIMAQREAYRTQQRKAMQQQIISTVAAAALSYGFGKLGSKGSAPKTTGTGAGTKASDLKLLNSIDTSKMFKLDTNSSFMNFTPGKAYGGMIRGFNNGGGPTDDIPALLMGGEYVMDRGTVRKYGKQYLDSMNSGRAKFAEGGYAGAETETTTESNDSKAKVDAATGTAVNISINVSGGSSSTESQGQTSQGGVDYKKMSERIKAVVLETINEEKRLGGALRSR
jgi:TP901 family phage tail tape measure protein